MTQITEDYVSFETSKLLKEKGFDENTPINYFIGDDKPRGCVVGEMIYHKRAEEDTHLIACPTLQMAMKWLREVHKLGVFPSTYTTIKGNYITHDYGTAIVSLNTYKLMTLDSMDKETYEQACEVAIKYCLENLI